MAFLQFIKLDSLSPAEKKKLQRWLTTQKNALQKELATLMGPQAKKTKKAKKAKKAKKK